MKLEQFKNDGLEDIYFVHQIIKEFERAVNEDWKNGPPLPQCQKQLLSDLVVLNQEKEKAIGLKGFEKLGGQKELYSINRKTRKNVRVIFTFSDGVVILLTAFLEKNQGDYQRAINTANQRLKMLRT